MNNFQQRRLLGLVRLVVGAHGRFLLPPSARQTIYFANHTSHIDTLAILAALPESLRENVRPVAARDYWDSSPSKRYIAQRMLDVILIDRSGERTAENATDPLAPVDAALDVGESVILFPEGTRSADGEVHAFRSGLYWLAKRHPDVDLVPVYLSNLARAMPKGRFLPIPFMCEAMFGSPLHLLPDEPKAAFLERTRQHVIDLRDRKG